VLEYFKKNYSPETQASGFFSFAVQYIYYIV